MKILLDTNVLISAFVFGGAAGKVLDALLESSHALYVSDYIDAEFRAKLEQKWPKKSDQVYSLYRTLPFHFCQSTPDKLGNLRDKKDIPVLSDALFHHIDIILTGDKDFLEANLEKPIILSPAMFWEYLSRK